MAFLSMFAGGVAATRIWDFVRQKADRPALPPEDLIEVQRRLEEAEAEIVRLRAAQGLEEGRRLGGGEGDALAGGPELREEPGVARLETRARDEARADGEGAS